VLSAKRLANFIVLLLIALTVSLFNALGHPRRIQVVHGNGTVSCAFHSRTEHFGLNQTEPEYRLYSIAAYHRFFGILRFTFLNKTYFAARDYRNLPSVFVYFGHKHSTRSAISSQIGKRQTVFPFWHRIFDNNRLQPWPAM